MFPAPGVYDDATTLLAISVSACTTPLNLDMPASTVTMPAEMLTWLAFTVTFAHAVIVMPADSSVIEFPFGRHGGRLRDREDRRGAEFLLTAVGVAVLYAVNKGYVNVSVGAAGTRRGPTRPGARITVSR